MTALNIAVAVTTDGAGDLAFDAAADSAYAAAGEEGGSAVADAAESCLLGGESFTAGTKVVLANGKAVPISQLKPGEKVLATNTKTGKTQAETVAAVLVHHDNDLYDLTIKAHGRTTVIDTTSNHLFWVPGTPGHGRWVKAGALKYGTHLRTPTGGGGTVTVLGGWTPKITTGRMWDLTIPGDHDFYIDTVAAPVLVHNCNGGVYTLRDEVGNVVRTGRTSNLATRQYQLSRDPVLGQYRFQVEYRTDVYAEQRGLEQYLYDQYPEAQAANGGYNVIRAISPENPNVPAYMQAAADYLAGGG